METTSKRVGRSRETLRTWLLVGSTLLAACSRGASGDAPAGSASQAYGAPDQAAATPASYVRIAAGESAPYTDADGNVWDADHSYSGGAAFTASPAAPIAGTDAAPLYNSQRYGVDASGNPAAFSYALHMNPGSYNVTLEFAETYVTAPGKRLFNVSVNGAPVLSNFDIFATAGASNTAVLESFPVTVDSTGALSIQFAPGSMQNPMINAIAVAPTSALEITSALALSEPAAAPGDTLTGTVTYTNRGAEAVDVSTIVVAARPPGGTHVGGPFANFSPAAPMQSLAPGASLTVVATRPFSSTDPVGAWDVYPTWEDGAGTWHDGPGTSLTVDSGGTSGSDGGTGGGASRRFSIANGQIVGPDGSPFVPVGIAVPDEEASTASTNAAAQPLTSLFPGINVVRLACETMSNAPSYYADFVSQLTSNHIAVVIENHSTPGGGQGTNPTGEALTAELSWYGALATAFLGNPYVWFGTSNEPPNTTGASGTIVAGTCTAEQAAIYQAIRDTGNDTIIEMEQVGGGNPPWMGANNPDGLYPSSTYATMHNIIWGPHFYNWITSYSTDVAASAAELSTVKSLSQEIESADGLVPVVIFEYGVSTTGTTPDVGGIESVTAVEQSGLGQIAWSWGPYSVLNSLCDDSGTMTAWGTMTADFLAHR